jgi:hypothetical protein
MLRKLNLAMARWAPRKTMLVLRPVQLFSASPWAQALGGASLSPRVCGGDDCPG